MTTIRTLSARNRLHLAQMFFPLLCVFFFASLCFAVGREQVPFLLEYFFPDRKFDEAHDLAACSFCDGDEAELGECFRFFAHGGRFWLCSGLGCCIYSGSLRNCGV